MSMNEGPDIRTEFDAHIDELLELLVPERVGPAYEAAHAAGDRAGMIRAAAAYYRHKPSSGVEDFEAGPYDPELSRRRAAGQMREINIDHDFPGGAINFLYNPTLEKPPVNHEWLWQLNRHGWWVGMACAYADTGDEMFAAAFDRQLRDWIAQTRLHDGWNGPGSAWRTIECGLRLLGSWPTAFNLFRTSPSVSDETLLLMVASMHRQAVHLDAHPTGGNWLMMESNGTYTFGSLFPELRDAETLRLKAGQRLSTELDRQILPDGLQYELSPDYHIVTYGCALGLYKVAAALGRTDELPRSYRDTLRRMTLAGVELSTPGFTQPRTNDCYTMQTKILTRAAERLFPEEPAFAYVNSDRTRGHAPAGETASRFLPWSGFAAMRTDWSADAAFLCFDVGPLGMGHMHQDKLNINLYKGSDELIFDDGGGQYEQSWARSYGLSGYDHNTALVDGQAQARRQPLRVTSPIDAGWITNDVFDYASGILDDGFGPEQARTAVHKREVRFCKPDFFAVRDTLTSADGQPHTYALRFHTDSTEIRPVPGLPGAILASPGQDYDLLLVSIPGADGVFPDVQTAVGQREPVPAGWYIGRNDRSNHPAATITLSSPCLTEWTALTLLFPVKRGDALPEVSAGADEWLTVAVGGKTYRLDPKAMNK